VNKLNEIYFVFAEAQQPLTHDQKVKTMCEKITTSSTKLETAITVIKMDQTLKYPPEDYFVKAANSLAEQIAIIFPNAKAKPSRYVSYAGRGRGNPGGRRGVRGGRGGRGGHRGGKKDDFPAALGGNPGDVWNGTDISDLTKYFPKPVFNSFPPGLKTKIHHAKNGGGTPAGGKRNIHAVEIDDMKSQVSSMADELAQVRAVMQASRDNLDTESAASTFGRPGLPPHKKSKTPRAGN
jgi:hypothetical protein